MSKLREKIIKLSEQVKKPWNKKEMAEGYRLACDDILHLLDQEEKEKQDLFELIIYIITGCNFTNMRRDSVKEFLNDELSEILNTKI